MNGKEGRNKEEGSTSLSSEKRLYFGWVQLLFVCAALICFFTAWLFVFIGDDGDEGGEKRKKEKKERKKVD